MGFLVALFGFCLVNSNAFAAPTPAPQSPPQNAWSRISQPSTDAPQSIGFYSAGCIAGAQKLPLVGLGFQVMRAERNRSYGNPELLQFVQDLAIDVSAVGSGLLIGDLGQARGGPMPYGHTSHQVGLDADIWFWTHPEQDVRSLSMAERAQLPMISVLNANGVVDTKKFAAEQILKLRLASDDLRVQRIFVNPAIKVYLCSVLKPEERGWLHKLRPWPGHDSHFHVRLYCPSLGHPSCIPQAEIPAGDGCSEVMPIQQEAVDHKRPDREHPDYENPEQEQLLERFFTPTQLPAACSKLLQKKKA